MKFLGDMMYGIMASGTTVLSEIVRSFAPDGKQRSVENRLSFNLERKGLADEIHAVIAEDAKRFINRKTLIIIDPTEVCKPHAYRMEFISRVRDASKSTQDNPALVNGYHGCMAIACKSGSRKTIPLALRLWSTNAKGHIGENDEVLKTLKAIDEATNGIGIRVYDRGGDRKTFYDHFLDHGHDFIVRIKERTLSGWRGLHEAEWLAQQCVMKHRQIVNYDSHGRETKCTIDFGVVPVLLPWRDEPLRLVVVKGYGHKPMMLLTNLAGTARGDADDSYAALWQVVEGYLSRWRIEETIRFVKQSYGFEKIRVMAYEKWKNMAAIVLATAYFTAAWLGHDVKKEAMVDHLEHMHQRLNEVPEFFLYALAAGLKRAFTRYGCWAPKIEETKNFAPMLPGWDEMMYTGAG